MKREPRKTKKERAGANKQQATQTEAQARAALVVGAFDLFSVERPFLECLAAFEVFRRAGFPSDDIYFDASRIAHKPAGKTDEDDNEAPGRIVPVHARMCVRQGSDHFIVNCGPLSEAGAETEKHAEEVWALLAGAVRDGHVSEQQLSYSFGRSLVLRERLRILQGLVHKGFFIPAVAEREMHQQQEAAAAAAAQAQQGPESDGD